MFCENCGNKLQEKSKFCTQCGQSVVPISESVNVGSALEMSPSSAAWWYRLLKVVYITLYIPLPFILWLVWSENSSYYSYYSNVTTYTIGEAFCYSLLTLVIYLSILRLVKIATLYIAIGRKPEWGKEFKHLY